MNDPQHEGRREVIVTDIRMPFASMVAFMVKWAIAAIPAMLILGLLWYLLMVLLFGIGGGMFGPMGRMHA
jgi:hypothetical protein